MGLEKYIFIVLIRCSKSVWRLVCKTL